jgi:hypothetical protein
MRKLFVFCLLLLNHFSFSQVAINNTNSPADNSAMLDVTSTNKGLLIPRMTTAQRMAIAGPVKGLIVYDSTGNSLWYYDGLTWGELSAVNASLWKANGNNIYNTNSGNIGIGVNPPEATALLQISTGASTTNGFLITGTFNNSGTVPDLGTGTRLMFYPGKAAFRAGWVCCSLWDNANVGQYSVAMGSTTKASGYCSTALGLGGYATGTESTAMGYNTLASGIGTTAMGYQTIASGAESTSMGYNTTASGISSTAMGYNSIASGGYATVMGNTNTASGGQSTAMGFSNYARGYGSTVIGIYGDPILTVGETSPNANTPLFIISNGSSVFNRSNALVVQYGGNVGIGNSIPNTDALLHINTSTTNKGLLITGTPDGSATVPNLGAGSRMMFYPGKVAFRAGAVSSTQWDLANVGFSSIAMGSDTKANADYSTAIGTGTVAGGKYSIAMGYNTSTSGWYSTATGWSTTVAGQGSTAMGAFTNATGWYSTALGFQSNSNGTYSVAMGNTTTSNGACSMSMGYQAIAGGDFSSAIGTNTNSRGYASTVVGIYNDPILASNQTGATSTTPLFMVGNGDDDATRSNAFVVRKSGDVEAKKLIIGGGTTTIKQQTGTATVGPSGTNVATVTISFPTAFTGVPKIIGTTKNQTGWAGTDAFAVSTKTISATSVTFTIVRVDVVGANWAQNLLLDWLAWE